ncbi:MAG: hypothetical protein HYS09_02120 [Chloroflexi bacterium]|nr:hypothetical protein [Chloroflexota bacterium]
MIISIVTRRTEIKDREEWQQRLESVLPKIRDVLKGQPGFVSVQYLWGVEGDGSMGQITTWESLDECMRYVREGGAATVGAFEDRALPTASYPNGSWVRQTLAAPSWGAASSAPTREGGSGGFPTRRRRRRPRR